MAGCEYFDSICEYADSMSIVRQIFVLDQVFCKGTLAAIDEHAGSIEWRTRWFDFRVGENTLVQYSIDEHARSIE